MAMLKVKEINYPGGYREIIIHDNVINNKNNRQGGRKKNVMAWEVDEENIRRRINRVKRDIKRIALVNRLYRLMTLTFRENIQDVSIANNYFERYIKAMSYRGFEMGYIKVIELQERGAIHFHCLIDDYIPFRVAYEVWIKVVGSGSVNFKNVGIKGIFYLIKYVEKNIEENIFISLGGFSRHSYTVSRGLKRLTKDIVIETYGYILETGNIIGPGLKQVFNDIEKADKEQRIVYVQQGYYGEEKQYKYRCILIAPAWDKSYK